MASNWYNEQLQNRNYLSPIGFKFVLEKAPKVAFLAQSTNLPRISVGEIKIPTRGMLPVPLDGNAVYDSFSMRFLVDENLENYLQIHNWIRALGTPESLKERSVWVDEHDSRLVNESDYSVLTTDATLIVLNNNYRANFDVVFKNLYPTSLSTLQFDVTDTDNEYFTADVEFTYSIYEVRDSGGYARRKE